MAKKTETRKGRMIHIRLDDHSHRRLKIHAVQSDQSIQQIVEHLIRQFLPPSRGKATE